MMARCRAHKEDPDTGFELNCDLEDHDMLLTFHFDNLAFGGVEWRDPLVPSSVPLTRKPPLRVVHEAA
jgi:hypothetical protein